MKNDYRIADIALAEWGRKEIALAEIEMPGLMAIRAQYAPLTSCAQADGFGRMPELRRAQIAPSYLCRLRPLRAVE